MAAKKKKRAVRAMRGYMIRAMFRPDWDGIRSVAVWECDGTPFDYYIPVEIRPVAPRRRKGGSRG